MRSLEQGLSWVSPWNHYHWSYTGTQAHSSAGWEGHSKEHSAVNCSLGVKLGTGAYEELGLSLVSKFRESQFTIETEKKNPQLITGSQSFPLRKVPWILISAQSLESRVSSFFVLLWRPWEPYEFHLIVAFICYLCGCICASMCEPQRMCGGQRMTNL